MPLVWLNIHCVSNMESMSHLALTLDETMNVPFLALSVCYFWLSWIHIGLGFVLYVPRLAQNEVNHCLADFCKRVGNVPLLAYCCIIVSNLSHFEVRTILAHFSVEWVWVWVWGMDFRCKHHTRGTVNGPASSWFLGTSVH